MTRFVRLGDVATSSYGFTASATAEDTGARFLRITDIVNGTPGSYDSTPFVETGSADASKFELKRGDVVIARTGATVGTTHWFTGWPEPVLFASYLVRFTPIADIVNSRFLGYVLRSSSWSEHVYAHAYAKSAQPNMSARAMAEYQFQLPPLAQQQKTAAVLGSLDDKIAANSHAIEKALNLQSASWEAGTLATPSVPLLEVAEPMLGGTPSRKDETSWGGGYKWASVTDMTASPRSHLLNTAETISAKAAEKKRFSPLPAGSVLLSARGTVGRVVSLIEPISFNQSAYGFKAIPGFEAALRLAVTSIVDDLRAKSYGSVFSTITKTQINEATVPDVFNDRDQSLHQELNTLERLIVALERENNTLAKTRDELLPLLMSGKITVREAGQEAAAAGAQIPSKENEV